MNLDTVQARPTISGTDSGVVVNAVGALFAAAALLAMALLLGTSTVGAAPPLPLAPHSLPGDLGSFPAAGNQEGPVIVRGGDRYLVAWTDDRTNLFDSSGESGSAKDVYAARLDADGNLIDTTPIVISQAEHDQYDPVVVWNGQNWLVLWTGTVPYGPLYHRIIEAVRLSPDGVILDSQPILIWNGGTTRGTSGEHLFGAASDGTDWALIIVDEYISGLSTKLRLVGKRVTPDGTIIDAPYYLFSPSCCYFFYKGGLAFADGVYMAVFEGYVSGSEYGIFGLRMSPTLTTLDSYPVVLTQIPMQAETHYYRTPGIAGGNGMFYVGWQLYISGTSSQIYGARVAATGLSLDGNGLPISDPEPLSLYLSPDLTWDGTQWIAGWNSSGQFMARIDAGGVVLDSGGVDLQLPSGAFAGTGSGGVQAVWSEALVGDPMPLDVFTATISAGLGVGADACVSLGAPSQTQADLATGTTGQMLVYRSAISGQRRILAHPLDSSGEALTPQPVQLAAGEVNDPRVAFDGQSYLIVWSDDSSGAILGRRLAQNGTLLDPNPIAVMDGAQPDVAGRTGQFLVAANLLGNAAAVRVGGDGVVLDTPPLMLRTFVTGAPRATALGAYWLIVYEYANTPDGSEIESALVDMSGNVVGPVPISAASDGIAAYTPAVAAGDSALIVWQDARAGDGNLNLYGRRLSSSITFVDPAAGLAIATAGGNQNDAAVAWDGVRFLATFSDDRNVVNEIDVRTDVYRNWITGLGPVPNEEGLPLFSGTVPEIDSAVAGHDGTALYAASVFSSDSPHAAYRIQLRFAGLPTGVGDRSAEPERATRLLASFPNPANPAVQIRFSLARPSGATVSIFDLRGARIRTLMAENLQPGQHELTWDGTDDSGRQAPSGTYLYRLTAAGAEDSGKLVLVQ